MYSGVVWSSALLRQRSGVRLRSAPNGPDCGLEPGVEAELFQQILDVHLHGGVGDLEVARDQLVGESLSKPPQDLLFAIGQGGAVALLRRGFLAYGARQQAVQALADHGAAVE